MPSEDSGGDTERLEDQECYHCGTALDTHQDDHFVLTEEPRPIPDGDEMEFDDWFRTNWIFCPDCAPDVECEIQAEPTQEGDDG